MTENDALLQTNSFPIITTLLYLSDELFDRFVRWFIRFSESFLVIRLGGGGGGGGGVIPAVVVDEDSDILTQRFS